MNGCLGWRVTTRAVEALKEGNVEEIVIATEDDMVQLVDELGEEADPDRL